MIEKTLYIFLFMLIASSCSKDKAINPALIPESGEQFPGGSQSTFNQSANAFGDATPGLSGINANYFFTGNSLFNQNWVSSPSSTTARDGLGPTLNSRSCSGCHFKDGRGKPPTYFDELSSGFLVRLSIPGSLSNGAPNPEPNYGEQLQDQSIQGVLREGQIAITYTEITGKYEDGSSFSLRKPNYSFPELNFGGLASDVMISPRIGQQMIGLGLLEAINESDILLKSDPFDADNDGISGKPNYVWNVIQNMATLGKFGWKANQPNVKQQVAGAFHGDMGITSSLFSSNDCPGPQSNCASSPNGGNPEIEDDNLDKVVLYSSNLAVPSRPNYKKEEVLLGKKIFNDLNCVKCHTPSYTTGKHPLFNHLSNQKIWPYTDLLLHDMGDELADGRPDFLANGNEWRTPPLWGIGLVPIVNGHTFYLHDGRARNLTEAVLWHGGEASASKEGFKKLSANERQQLIKFLESL